MAGLDRLGGNIDVVITYLGRTKSGGEELRYALRGIHENVPWARKVWVVGDAEPWFSDKLNHLQVDQLPRGTPHRRCQDGIHKVLSWIEHPDSTAMFVWWYDDIYAVNPLEITDIFPNPSMGSIDSDNVDRWVVFRPWKRWKRETFMALAKQGIPIWDMTTHLPQVFITSLLKKVVEEYPPVDGNLPQVVYGSDLHFNTGTKPPPISDGLRIRSALTDKAPTVEEASAVKLLCPSNGCWDDEAHRKLVRTLLPNPCPYEKVEEVAA